MIRGALPLSETRAYRLKRAVLGRPLVSEQLSEQRLPNPLALGVLAPDCISSTAYGSEEMLTILVPAAGAAAFALLLPVTIAIIVVLFFVTLSYREVVMVYTRAGGSYVVARENFGLKTAQVAAVALLIDYTVTVAVQSAAGTDALTSAVPSLTTYQVPITIAVVVVLVYGNLRGIREAGKAFALPTYLFIFTVALLIVVGVIRAVTGGLAHAQLKAGVLQQRASDVGHTGSGHGLLLGVAVFTLLKSFANGGSSLTGLEAISNGVGSFQPPEGRNARRTLVLMSCTLGFLVLGVSYLAHVTHATPYGSGSPTVLSQETKVVFGSSAFGHVIYLLVQLVTLLILYTGANTSFNGFPFLASFVAGDRFLPLKLTKRGHRLVFSNGIIVLAVISITLLLVTRAKVDALVAVYAIGVFTGFTMAGAGMSKYHWTHRERGWRRRLLINGFAAVLTFAVVIIFAVTKFTQGAWVVVVLFPIMWLGLTRLNRRYREEASVLGETIAEAAAEARPLARSVGIILVDRLDLATARAIQYARTLSLDDLRAVHFVIDEVRAERLQQRWVRLGLRRFPLELVDCPDRRVVRASLERANAEVGGGQTELTVILPRRHYQRFWSRILHDATGERIAATLSRLPHVAATILPLDVDAELRDRRRAAAVRVAPPPRLDGGDGATHRPTDARSGSTDSGSTGSGSTAPGSTSSEPTASGSTGSGSTASGSTASGSTASGSTGSGSTGSGSTGSGSTGSGSTGSGSTGSESTGSGSTGSGSTGSGSTGSESTASGSTASGATSSGENGPGGHGPGAGIGAGTGATEGAAGPNGTDSGVAAPAANGAAGAPSTTDPAEAGSGDRLPVPTARARAEQPGGDASRPIGAIGAIEARRRVRVAGRITSVTVQAWGSVPTLECELRDATGSVVVAFLGRRRIPGIAAGRQMEITGMAGERNGRIVVINPDYQLIRPAGSAT